MPSIAGVVEPPFKVRYSTKGVSDVTTADLLTVVVLHHYNSPPIASTLLAEYQRRGLPAIHDRTTDCAVVLIDEKERRVVLSRDRIGVHPLYYEPGREGFSFGSTVASVRTRRGSPNREALAALLVHGSAAALTETYFDGIHSVAPGETLYFENERFERIPAAAPSFIPRTGITFDEAAQEFAQRFKKSVARRLDGDGATAVLVSGGLDSAAIIAFADAGRATGITYGLTDGSAADESRYIRLLQDAGHRIERVAFDPIIDVASLEQNVRAIETPYGDDVPATLTRAARRARDLGCNALLIGTWGDQVLAPFPPPHLQRIAPHRVLKLRQHAERLQHWMIDVPVNRIYSALIRQSLRAHLPRHLLSTIRRRRAASSLFDLLKRDYPTRPFTIPPESYREAVYSNVSAPDQVEAMEGTTKWGMANELEIRLPFLDRELIDYLLRIPDEIAFHENSLKPLLRAAMQDRLPSEIVTRRDKGDYTNAIRSRSLQLSVQVEELDGLRRFIDFGLMSEIQARKTLAKLTHREKISSDTPDVAGSLLSVDVWLRIFFEAL